MLSKIIELARFKPETSPRITIATQRCGMRRQINNRMKNIVKTQAKDGQF